jgi:hypothetical protein
VTESCQTWRTGLLSRQALESNFEQGKDISLRLKRQIENTDMAMDRLMIHLVMHDAFNPDVLEKHSDQGSLTWEMTQRG